MRVIYRLLPILFMFLLVVGCAPAEETNSLPHDLLERCPLLTVDRIRTPPVLDGNFDDDCWSQAAGACFPVSPDEVQGRFLVCYDRENIYLAVRFDDDRISESVAQERERDGQVWQDESLEVFVNTKARSSEYFQLVVNMANSKFDAQVKSGNSDKKWDGNWQSSVQRDEAGWQIELSIPFADLDGRPVPGETWGFNVCRNRILKDQPDQRATWSPLLRSFTFHNPHHFGRLRWTTTLSPVQVTSLGDYLPGRQQFRYSTRGDRETQAMVAGGLSVVPDQLMYNEIMPEQDAELIVNYGQKVSQRVLSFAVRDTKKGALLYCSGHVQPALSSQVPTLLDNLHGQPGAKALQAEWDNGVAEIESKEWSYFERKEAWARLEHNVQEQSIDLMRGAMLAQGPRDEDGSPWMGLAVASSMQKVFPTRPDLFRGTFTNRLSLTAARGEMAAGQLVVCAVEKDLSLDLMAPAAWTNSDGIQIENENIAFAPIGFTMTTNQPYYAVEHVGWWPDPILDYLTSLTIKPGDLQSFWVSVKVPRDCPAGTYEGQVQFVQGEYTCSVPVSLTVWDFTLPKKPSLNTAITVSLENIYTSKANGALENLDAYHIEFEKFMAAHRFNYGSLYRTGKCWRGALPGQKEFTRWRDLGMGSFNIMRSTAYNTQKAKGPLPDDKRPEFRNDIQGVLDAAKAAGMASNAYLYGWDEWKSDKFSEIEKTSTWLKKEFPDLPLFTTAIDNSYGLALPMIDWFCPEIFNYYPDRAREARQRGKQVWWYVCVATKKPYPNVFVDYPAIDSRLLTGFMSFEYEVDGFLYYSMLRPDNNRDKLISGGPYLDWDARSWNYAHGDGHLVYPGPDGPVSSIRMENLLDGMEDYEYLVLATQAVQRLRDAGFVEDAERIASSFADLTTPGNDLVFSTTSYSSEPAVLEAARLRLAQAILEAQAVEHLKKKNVSP